MEPLRVYLDTSVFGGCFDDEFREPSVRLFDAVRQGRLTALVSETVTKELILAPQHVRELASGLPVDRVEAVGVGQAVQQLVDAYLAAGIVGPQSIDDATHVAAATVANADAIVSWNFRHIVRLDRIKAYNTVNQQNGFSPIYIQSPMEVNFGDEDR